MAMHLMNWLFYLFSFLNIWHDVRGQKRILHLQPGETFSIDCSDTLQGSTGLYLYRTLSEKTLVLFWNATNDELTANTTFRHRAKMERNYKNLRFNLTDMMESDSAVYWCSGGLDRKHNNRSAVLVVVSGDAPCDATGWTDGENAGSQISANDEDSFGWSSFFYVTIGLSVAATFLCVAIIVFFLISKMKKSCERTKTQTAPTDFIYEDMQRCHRST